MCLVKINPSYHVLDQLFEDVFLNQSTKYSQSYQNDITENESQVVVTIPLPGVKKENVKVGYVDGELTIDVNPNLEKDSSDTSHDTTSKWSNIKFKKRYHLEDINFKETTATLEDGILTIKCLKKPKEEPRYLTIK